MIAVTRRLLRGRRPSTPAGRPRGLVRGSAPAAIAVVDGLGGTTAARVARALGADASLVSPAAMVAGFGCVALLLPLQANELAFETHEALSVLSSVAGDPELATGFAPGLVVVWCVTAANRRRLAVTHGAGVRNSAALLLGTSWHRERTLHAGDKGAAVRCRSAAILGMVDATGDRSLAGVLLADITANITALDRDCLHTVAIRLRDDRWSGAEAVVAAVRERRRMASRG